MEAKLLRAKWLIDFYFSPWGAKKGAIWEEVLGVPVSPTDCEWALKRILNHDRELSLRIDERMKQEEANGQR